MEFLSPGVWLSITQSSDPPEFWLLLAGLVLLAAYGFYAGFRSLRHARLIEDTPTAKIRSAAQGPAELSGGGELMDGDPILAPLTGQYCLWWDYRIQKRQGKRWCTIDSATSDALFLLQDDTGRCIVDPEGARVVTAACDRWYGDVAWPEAGPKTGVWFWFGRYKYEERRLMPHDALYALGWFETRGGSRNPAELEADVRVLLAQWKRNRPWLREHFDRNGDGEVDFQEWEAARHAAHAQVEAEAARAALEPHVHLLIRPPDGETFLLSDVPPATLSRRLRLKSLAWLAGFFIGGGASVIAISARLS